MYSSSEITYKHLMRNLGAIFSKRLFPLKSKLEENASSGSIEQSVTQGQDELW